MERAKSCVEPDLENMVVEGWVEFDYLPKTGAVGERYDKAYCCGTISNCSLILMAKWHPSIHSELSYTK
jgi:hypothetical protein